MRNKIYEGEQIVTIEETELEGVLEIKVAGRQVATVKDGSVIAICLKRELGFKTKGQVDDPSLNRADVAD